MTSWIFPRRQSFLPISVPCAYHTWWYPYSLCEGQVRWLRQPYAEGTPRGDSVPTLPHPQPSAQKLRWSGISLKAKVAWDFVTHFEILCWGISSVPPTAEPGQRWLSRSFLGQMGASHLASSTHIWCPFQDRDRDSDNAFNHCAFPPASARWMHISSNQPFGHDVPVWHSSGIWVCSHHTHTCCLSLFTELGVEEAGHRIRYWNSLWRSLMGSGHD